MFYKAILVTLFLTNFLQAKIDELKNLKSLESDFIQTINSTSGTKIEYKGKLYIKDSGKVLYSYKEPIEKNVYINKNEVIIDEPELEQAIITTLDNQIDILKLINDAKKVKESLYSTKIEGIEYNISLLDGNIDKIYYVDEIENSVEIKLLNTILNEEISDSKFMFILPRGYDLIRK